MFSTLRSQWQIILILAQVVAAFSLSSRFMGLLAPFIKRDLTLTDLHIGILISAIPLGSFLTSHTIGRFVDRYDSRSSLSIGLLLVGATLGLAAFRYKFWWLLLTLILAGGVRSLVGLGINVAIVRFIPAKVWGLSTGIIRATGSSADLVAALILPFVAVTLGWQYGIAFVVATVAISAIIVRSQLPTQPPKVAKSTRPENISRLTRERPVLLLSIFYSGYLLSLLAVSSFFLLYLVEQLGISPVLAGVYFAISQAAAIGGQVIWGIVADNRTRGGKRRLMSGIGLGSALGIAFLSLLPYEPEPILVILSSAFIGLTLLASWGVISALVLDVADPDYIGNASAVFAMSVYVTGIISPIIFGFLASMTNSYRMALQLFSGITLLAAMLFWAIRLEGRGKGLCA